MVAYSFNRRFIGPIVAGTKQQTIRAIGRRRHARRGEAVQLYTGMRTKHCAKIGTAICTSALGIEIDFESKMILLDCIDGDMDYFKRMLIAGMVDNFARDDGFADWPEMHAFWKKAHGPDLPPIWNGIVICWDNLRVSL